MEIHYRGVNQAVYNDKTCRLDKRPQDPSTEQAFVDMSTPFVKGGQIRDRRKACRRLSSETDSDPDSLDPLDFLSSPSRGDDGIHFTAKDGTKHQWDPNFPPDKDKALKELRFTKKKKKKKSEDGPSTENCSSNVEDIFDPEMPRKKTYDAGGKSNASSFQSTRTTGATSARRVTSPPIDIPSGSDKEEAPVRPKRQPKPFPGPSRSQSREPNASPRSSHEDGASPVSKQKAKKKRPQPQSFPAISPLHARKESLSRSTSATPTKSKTVQHQPFPIILPLSSPVTSNRALILPSPLSTPTNKKPMKLGQITVLHLPSPLNSQQSTINAKGKERAVSQPTKGKNQGEDVAKSKSWRVVDSEEVSVDETKPTRRPQPFPVTFSPQLTPRAPKRSSDGLESDTDKSRKKQREHILKTLPDVDLDDLDEDDAVADNAIFLDPSIDPRMLCPYCDTRLPDRPTPLLRRLLANIAKKSRPSPRPTNPLGRKAPLEVFIALCQRHRFESVTLPEAERNGWPKEIAWAKLEGRVQKMKRELRALISDRNARSNSIFWTEIMKEVKAKGSRAVAGVRNQFATFEKTQPGYYGEQGSVIIYQTLFNLFPPASIHPDQVKPLTPNEFTQRILVPEVATRLIRQDMGVSPSKAVKILRESASYGVAMFPEDGGGWGEKKDDDAMGVADLMVMARARKRRIELEREEREEEEMLKRMQEAEAMNVDLAPPSRPKTKPICKHKAQASTDPTSESEAVSESEELKFENFVLGSDDPDPEPQLRPPPMFSDTDDDGGIRPSGVDISSSPHVDIDLTRDSRSRSLSTSDAESTTSKSTTRTRESRAYRRLRGGDPPSDAESTASKQLAKYKSEERDTNEEAQPRQAPVRVVDNADTPRPAAPTFPLLLARGRRAGNAKPAGESFEWLLD